MRWDLANIRPLWRHESILIEFWGRASNAKDDIRVRTDIHRWTALSDARPFWDSTIGTAMLGLHEILLAQTHPMRVDRNRKALLSDTPGRGGLLAISSLILAQITE